MNRQSPERLMGIALAGSVVVLVGVLVVGLGSGALGGGAATPSPAVTSTAPASPDATPVASPTKSAAPSATFTPWATPTPVPTPTPPPELPALLGAIGDSYTQAWSVSPSYKYDHPQFSWAVGYAKGDGVFSLQERFNALGDKIGIMDAATSGTKMIDAERQANIVVAAAKKLPAGSTAFVTFELGTNDLCDFTMTTPTAFETQLRAAMTVLEGGLPPGSRMLMLSVPDFNHFYAITQANPKAKSALGSRYLNAVCPPFLGTAATHSLAQASTTLASYNNILYKVCDEVEARDGASGTLHCRHDEAVLSERDFVIGDLSTADYFHPSLTGQAKMAAAAWKASWWSAMPLPAGTAY
jgi:lysophospholipase L1-like esterase